MNEFKSYEVITEVSKKLAKSLEGRKKNKELVSYEVEPIYDDYRIEVRVTLFEGLPELVFTLDILNGKQGKDSGDTGMAGE